MEEKKKRIAKAPHDHHSNAAGNSNGQEPTFHPTQKPNPTTRTSHPPPNVTVDRVNVVLTQDIPQVKGYAGKVYSVAAGYAREYLIPLKKAVYEGTTITPTDHTEAVVLVVGEDSKSHCSDFTNNQMETQDFNFEKSAAINTNMELSNQTMNLVSNANEIQPFIPSPPPQEMEEEKHDTSKVQVEPDDEDVKLATAIALSASTILSQKSTQRKTSHAFSISHTKQKKLNFHEGSEKHLVDPAQRKLIEQAIQVQQNSQHSHNSTSTTGEEHGHSNLYTPTSAASVMKKEISQFANTVNKTMGVWKDHILQNSETSTSTSTTSPRASMKLFATQQGTHDSIASTSSLVQQSSTNENLTPIHRNNGTSTSSDDKVTLSTLCYKKRSGLGQLSLHNAWERRKLVLMGTKLMYFKINEQDRLDPQESSIPQNVPVLDEPHKPTGDPEGERDIVQPPNGSNDGQTSNKAPAPNIFQLWEQAAYHIQAARDNITNSLLAQAEPAFGSVSLAHFDNNSSHLPRGVIDLWKENAMAALSMATPFNVGFMNATSSENTVSPSVSTSSSSSTTQLPMNLHSAIVAPTPFCLSILVKSDVKWKFCFDTQREQMMWLAALSDILVEGSVRCYNEGLSRKNASLDGGGDASQSSVYGVFKSPPSGNTPMWRVDQKYSLMNALSSTERIVPIKAEQDEEKEKGWILLDKLSFGTNKCAWVVAQAMAAYFFHLFSFRRLLIVLPLLLVNISWFLIRRKEKDKYKDDTNLIEDSKSIGDTRQYEIKAGVKPMAGSTTLRVQNPTDNPMHNNRRLCTWMSLKCNDVQVRSLDYLSTKKKVPSPSELYEVIRVDVFRSRKRVPEIAQKVNLPKSPFSANNLNKKWKSPDIFVISIAIPTESPNILSPSTDGEGFTVTVYYSMKQETRKILEMLSSGEICSVGDEEQTSIVNGVKLFEEYCKRAPVDAAFFQRFKLIFNIHNLSETGLPSWISSYCGKPVLIKRKGVTGFFFDYPELDTMEFDISLHPFPYLAKQATSLMKDKFFKKFLVSVSFVIEGRCKTELPEVLIGEPIQLCYPDPACSLDADDFFSGIMSTEQVTISSSTTN